MHRYLFFLGSHSTLSASECWQFLVMHAYKPHFLYGTEQYLDLELEHSLTPSLLSSLGGVERVAHVINETNHELNQEELLALLSPLPKKFMIGMSTISTPTISTRWLVTLKKTARQQGSQLKFVEAGKGSSRLNSAAVLFNSLYKDPNFEITLIKNGERYIYAKTIWVQDIQAYEKRDTAKPVRDTKNGMLPPKLAQIMLNLATAASSKQGDTFSILDPFCGSGVVLQEGWLQGHTMTGSDNNPAMISASKKNLAWLEHSSINLKTSFPTLFVHDVTQPFDTTLGLSFDAIVSEPFLGEGLFTPLSSKEQEKLIEQLSSLYLAFFRQVYPLLQPKGTIVFALPFWKKGTAVLATLPDSLIDEISKIGYRIGHLVPSEIASHYQATTRGTLLYGRPDALVGRELSLWHKV